MRLAEALIERKAIKTKMEELKKRIYQNARVQEGEEPLENPEELLEELKTEVEKFETLVVRINQSNQVTLLADDSTMMEAIVKKDMLHYVHLILTNLADKATHLQERYSLREVKTYPTINVRSIRKQAEEIAKAYRLLDGQIQEANWRAELL